VNSFCAGLTKRTDAKLPFDSDRLLDILCESERAAADRAEESFLPMMAIKSTKLNRELTPVYQGTRFP
jgi:hypothetical protein